MGRRAAKVDINQAQIVADLRTIPGCRVTDLSGVGMGCPDILVGYRGGNYLIEIKSEWARMATTIDASKLTLAQRKALLEARVQAVQSLPNACKPRFQTMAFRIMAV